MVSLPEAMKKNAVVIEKPSGTISTRVDLNAIQRKFYNVLLYIAKQELKKNGRKKRFAFPLAWLKSALNKSEMDKNNSYYIGKLKELKKKDVEYNVLGKDKSREWGLISLVSALYVKEKDGVMMIRFEFPEDIIDALLDPNGIYANINLVVIGGLSSKYAITLYELAKDYEKVEIPEMTMKEFRKIFNVEDKYRLTRDLKKNVIEPAINEINESDSIDFLVDYKMRKLGPRYTHIKFTVKPKPAKLKGEQTKKKLTKQILDQTLELAELLNLIPEEYRQKKNLISLLLGGIEKKGVEYTKAQIEYVNSQKNIKNYISYLKKAIENDYASAEVVNLDDVIKTEDDWKKKLIEKNKTYIFDGGEYKMKLIEDCDEDGYCNVQFRDIKDNERVKWVKVLEEKLKEMAEK